MGNIKIGKSELVIGNVAYRKAENLSLVNRNVHIGSQK